MFLPLGLKVVKKKENRKNFPGERTATPPWGLESKTEAVNERNGRGENEISPFRFPNDRFGAATG